MKPPAGVKLTNGRVEDGVLVYDLQVTRWHSALVLLRAVLTGRVRVRRA